MRITFLTWRDTAHPDGGGSEVYVEQIAERLVDRGHQVTVFTAKYPGALPRETRAGVHYVRKGGRLTVYPRGLIRLLGRSGRNQDVVVEVINGLPFAARLVRRRGLFALVHHSHEHQWQMIYPGLGGRLGWAVESRVTPRLYRHVPHVTVSGPSRDDLHALGIPAQNITIVRNGLVASTAREPEKSTAPRLCVLGRLVPHKQVEHALDVVAGLRASGVDVELDVVGAGWWADHLIEHAGALAVDDLVHFHGHVDDAERDLILGRAWLHLLPSAKEGWGLAVLDAASQGTGTIAYRSAGGVQESIEDGVSGVLTDDPQHFFETVRALVSEGLAACAEIGRTARKRAARFDWDQSTDAFERTIRTDLRR